MEELPPPPSTPPPLAASEPSLREAQPSAGELRQRESRGNKVLGPIGAALALLASLFGKLKLLAVPLLKFFPILLKTGGSMILAVGAYALFWGWWFALGFVLLILVHECGHLIAAKRFGLKVGAPVFIPFMGAFIALKEAPRNAWIEAWVGIGGPLLGTFGAGMCVALGLATGNRLFDALAYVGFFLNLFNLTPVGFLDGGRIVTALSPKLWVVGLVILGAMLFQSMNPILVLLLVLSLPRVFSLFRAKTDEEKRFFEVTPQQRAVMGTLYFSLIGVLVFGMHVTYTALPAR